MALFFAGIRCAGAVFIIPAPGLSAGKNNDCIQLSEPDRPRPHTDTVADGYFRAHGLYRRGIPRILRQLHRDHSFRYWVNGMDHCAAAAFPEEIWGKGFVIECTIA